MFHVLFYYFPSWDFIFDNDNGSQSHNENDYQKDSSKNRASYTPTLIFF